MKFFYNRIATPTGDAPTFDEWLQKNFGVEQEVKTASEAAPGIGLDMGNEPRGQQRGQVINNDNEEGAHSYQEGESVDGKSDQGGNARPDTGGTTDQKEYSQSDKGGSATSDIKEAKCGKEMGESDDAGKVTEEHTEAGPGDSENPEPKVLINNDPNYQKGESTDPGKVKGKSKKQPGEPVGGKSSSSAQFKKIAKMNRKEKLALFAAFSANKNNPLPYVEAMVGLKFANLTDEEKNWFREFWKVLYPPEYVENMVEDR